MFSRNFELHLRVFPVLAHDHRTGSEEALCVPVTKDELRASQVCGQSSKELVTRLVERQGYSVIEIGVPDKQSVKFDLVKLAEWWENHESARRKEDYLVFHSLGGGEC